MDAIVKIDDLPLLRTQETTKQISTHDKTGNNVDGGRTEPGIESYLYIENGKYIVFDEKGPGCVYRIWNAFLDMRGINIQFFFDGETVPRIDIPVYDFFSGNSKPFIFPFNASSAVSSGGYYSYYPITYKKSLKIAYTNLPGYYQITYKSYHDDLRVKTYTGNESAAEALDLLTHCGRPPYNTTYVSTILDTFSLQAKSLKTISINSPGTILGIYLENIKPWSNYNNEDFNDNLLLKFFWDEATEPQVLAPVSLFFAGGIDDFSCQALPVGSNPTTRKYYCYFPMPFKNSATLTIENRSNRAAGKIAIKIDYRNEHNPGVGSQIGYFRTTYQSGNTKPDYDFILLNTKGTGHIVGCVLSVPGGAGSKPFHLEGDERIHIDGSKTPQIYGTGTEDLFNGGWYFKNGKFTLPYHGLTFGSPYESNRLIMYRFFLTDNINFYKHILFGLEHGAINDVGGYYQSLTFWYGILDSTITQTDFIEIGDTQSETAHQYAIAGPFTTNTQTDAYEGDDPTLITDSGHHTQYKVSFYASILSKNKGMRIRRRFSYRIAHQQADVYVDGVRVGTWYSPGRNTALGWADSDFEVASTYTEGKSRVYIEIDPQPYGKTWTAYNYEIMSYYAINESNYNRANKIQIVGGQDQSSTPTTILPLPLSVAVMDENGNPINDFPVTFEIISGGGYLSKTNQPSKMDSVLIVQSDQDGIASVFWKMGKHTGEEQRVKVSALLNRKHLIGSPAFFNATLLPGPPAQLLKMTADTLFGEVGKMLPNFLAVKLLDQWNNPISNAEIRYSVEAGQGNLEGKNTLTKKTDSSGQAQVSWQLGTIASLQRVSAICTTAPHLKITFYARASAGPASQITPWGPQQFTVTAGARLTDPLAVFIADQYNNPVRNYGVRYHIRSGSGSLLCDNGWILTNEQGVASCSFKADSIITNNPTIIEVTADNLIGSPIVFYIKTIADKPYALIKLHGDNQKGYARQTLPLPLAVAVVDRYGNRIQNYPVDFIVTIESSEETLSLKTDTLGIASMQLTLGDKIGIYQIKAMSQFNDAMLKNTPIIFTIQCLQPYINIYESKILATSPIVASLKDSAIISIQIKDNLGRPIKGIQHRISAKGTAHSLHQVTSVTDDLGHSWGYLKATEPGCILLWVTVADTLATADSARVIVEQRRPHQLQIISGDNQKAMVATVLLNPIIVRLMDQRGLPLAGQELIVNVVNGGGQPQQATSIYSDENGIINFAGWQLGRKPGLNQLQIAVAHAPQVYITISAYAVLGVPKAMRIVSGDNQYAKINTVLPNPLVVQVTDSLGKGLLSIPVSFSATEDISFIGSGNDTTDENGIAQCMVKLGHLPGKKKILVSAENLKVEFTCTALTEYIETFQVISGDNQSGLPHRQLAEPIVVFLGSEQGYPAANQKVWSVVTQGGGSLWQPQPLVSNAEGKVYIYWILGDVGPQQLKISTENHPKDLYVHATALENAPPIIKMQKEWFAFENDSLVIPIAITDPNNDPATLRLLDLPRGMEVDSTRNYVLNWIPDFDQAGTYIIRVIATDQWGAATMDSLKIHIRDRNRPPKIVGFEPPVDTLLTKWHQTILFKITAFDLDHDQLYYYWYIDNRRVASNIDSLSIYIAPNWPPFFTVKVCVCDKSDTISHRWLVKTPQSVETPEPPLTLQLYQNHPNPFNAATTINFQVASPQLIEIAIYDVKGRRIRTLKSAMMPQGTFSCSWNGDADNNEFVPSGIYYCVLRVGNFQRAIKMLLLR